MAIWLIRAVEIAIEQGEAEALAYLHEHGAEPRKG